MSILELRILPALAVARLGASPTPLENYELVDDPSKPLGYRAIKASETLELDETTGEISRVYLPAEPVRFRDGEKIRPVAPFFEVFARTADDRLEPLTSALLADHGLTPADVCWTVRLNNLKLERRTQMPADRVEAIVHVSDHVRHAVEGHCANFLPGKVLPLGWVQYVKPTEAFPEIRFRFVPAKGLVYGAAMTRHTSPTQSEDDPVLDEDRIIYDPAKDWVGYHDGEISVPLRTNPGAIYAGYDRDDDEHVSWGYLDDECDGTITVELRVGDTVFSSFARVGAGPPTFAPDAVPIRTVADDLEQAVFGPKHDEPVDLAEAEEIVRKAVDTVRLLNTAAMNANAVGGRVNAASTMVRQDSADFSRLYEPIMAPRIVDQKAILALHQNILSALRSGTGAWFADTLRRPEEVGDLTDEGRRKMPAMMRGPDGRHLSLTRRQIDAVIKANIGQMFGTPGEKP